MGINDKPIRDMETLLAGRRDNGYSFYVLWLSPSGMRIWSGPYQSKEMASNTTAMRDKTKKAFVIEAK